MPEMTSFSFKVVRLKFHMACPLYCAGGERKTAGSKSLAADCDCAKAWWGKAASADRATMKISNHRARVSVCRDIGSYLVGDAAISGKFSETQIRMAFFATYSSTFEWAKGRSST